MAGEYLDSRELQVTWNSLINRVSYLCRLGENGRQTEDGDQKKRTGTRVQAEDGLEEDHEAGK